MRKDFSGLPRIGRRAFLPLKARLAAGLLRFGGFGDFQSF
jgi:hypothetical protein